MVKTHRFVRVNTSWGSYIRLPLKKRGVTIVTEDKERIDHFQGYVLSVSITSPKEVKPMFQNFPFYPNPSLEPSSFMLLGRDMDVFCDVLMDSNKRVLNFGAKISLKIAVAPGEIAVSATEFFTEKTQETLLKPFRHHLRGFTRTKVRGLVSCKIAKAAEVDITQDPAYDPETLLVEYELTNRHCQTLPRERNTKLACLAWQDASVEIERLLRGMSWKMLTDKGGVPFVSRIAEMYFLMKLNVARIGIAAMQEGETFADFLVEDALIKATKSLRDGHWMVGFKYQPTDTQRAKLNYERALLFRLEGNPNNIGIAVVLIQTAHHWLPQDADIAEERDRIMVWKALMG